jgi:hypothetical protein
MRNQAATFPADRLDVSDLTGLDLDFLAETILGQALAEAAAPVPDGEAYAGFNSSLPTWNR